MNYIFFYENYDIYKTEQLCANLYRLMEMILISKHLNKILVLPNFYFTPRNNELINEKDSLCIDRIELIDISNILDVSKIKEICNVISIADYFKLKLKDNILINKENDDVPYINDKYHTIYGILKISKNIITNYSSLELLEKIKDIDGNLIIHNYNRMGNPLWYRKTKLYYIIRNSIKFNKYYYEQKMLEMDFDNTLLVHWRRGDYKLNIADTDDTIEFFKLYNKKNKIDNLVKNILLRCLENKINNVLLLTNEVDNNELNELTNFLKNFDIKCNIYKSTNENNQLKYLTTDICSIILGAKCKYQLHGFGNYDRMSQFGRWIIEENMNNIKYFVE